MTIQICPFNTDQTKRIASKLSRNPDTNNTITVECLKDYCSSSRAFCSFTPYNVNKITFPFSWLKSFYLSHFKTAPVSALVAIAAYLAKYPDV